MRKPSSAPANGKQQRKKRKVMEGSESSQGRASPGIEPSSYPDTVSLADVRGLIKILNTSTEHAQLKKAAHSVAELAKQVRF